MYSTEYKYCTWWLDSATTKHDKISTRRVKRMNKWIGVWNRRKNRNSFYNYCTVYSSVVPASRISLLGWRLEKWKTLISSRLNWTELNRWPWCLTMKPSITVQNVTVLYLQKCFNTEKVIVEAMYYYIHIESNRTYIYIYIYIYIEPPILLPSYTLPMRWMDSTVGSWWERTNERQIQQAVIQTTTTTTTTREQPSKRLPFFCLLACWFGEVAWVEDRRHHYYWQKGSGAWLVITVESSYRRRQSCPVSPAQSHFCAPRFSLKIIYWTTTKGTNEERKACYAMS
jgi:hypothetical protein